jgi:hypothetical protein
MLKEKEQMGAAREAWSKRKKGNACKIRYRPSQSSSARLPKDKQQKSVKT